MTTSSQCNNGRT